MSREYHGIQEVIVQNFRAKPDTKMRDTPDAELEDLAATIAVARLVLGPKARIQAPPNLAGDEHRLILAAGVDDWGGVSPLTPDHVNPERPWPHIDDLAALTAAAGFALRERLTIYPPYVREPWLDPRVPRTCRARRPGTGLAGEDALPAGPPVAGAGRRLRVDRPHRPARVHRHRSAAPPIAARTSTRSTATGSFCPNGPWRLRAARQPTAPGPACGGAPARLASGGSARPGDVAAALRQAERDPSALTDDQAIALLAADGDDLDALAPRRRPAPRGHGDDVTFVVTRNINFTNVCYTGCRFCAFAQRRTDADAYTLSLDQIGERAEEAWAAGATEVCMQGGIHPDLPGTAYFDIAAEVKRRAPDMHVHAFRPMEVINGVARTGLPLREWLVRAREAGVDSLPGTAAEILDDDVRWVLTKGKLPAADWVEVITTAHGWASRRRRR